MKKRWICALLALALAAALLPAPALAAPPEDACAGSRLTGVDREVYDYLKTEIVKVAQGTRASTEFYLPTLSGLSWTVKELDAVGDGQADVLAKLKMKFDQTLHIGRIYDCLSADLPYDLFWKGNQYSWSYTQAKQGDRAFIMNLAIRIQVSEDYQGSGETSTHPAMVAAAGRAARTAQAIVARHAGESNYGKLKSYLEEICALTGYDMQALANGAPYGDPWQAVRVFDSDSSTNVVCEGYAKAFKYLCDLSEFDGGVACYLASGTANGGDHMWNVVRMEDGQCYLVDPTNSDEGMIGDGGELFLTGASGSGRSWRVSKEGFRVTYTYDDSQEGLYNDSWLALSAGDYVEPEPGSVVIQVKPSSPFLDVPAEAYYAGAVDWAVERGITQGTSADLFSPGEICTHAQILTFLWRAAGEPAVGGAEPEEAYYAAALRWAGEMEMLEDGFDPQAACARSDAVRYIWCAFRRPQAGPAGFADVPAGASYAGAVDWAVEAGVTQGTSDEEFSPGDLCSRGQIVTFLHRAYQ